MNVGDFADQEERPAYVRFERRAVEDKKESLKKGRSVSKDVDYALITPPYSKDLVEIKVDTWFENTRRNVKNGRTPKEWLAHWERAYEDFKNGQETPVIGTPIKEWSAISPAQIKNLIACNILTVEDLAQANDEGLRRMGMGGAELRRKASNWLKAASEYGPLTMKLTETETRCDRLQQTVDTQAEKIRDLVNQLEALRQPLQAIPEVNHSMEITMDDITPDPFEYAPAPVRDDTFTQANLEPEQGRIMSEQDSQKAINNLAETPDYANSTHDQLVGAHIRKFGKPPHHKAKDDTIRKKLEA